MNDYELACERFNRISQDFAKIVEAAQGVITWANEEYEAAQDSLRKYESSPGIPLPEYRQPSTIESPISGKTWTLPAGTIAEV